MFVDTGAWYAIADASDRHHDEAQRFYLAQAPGGRLVTTDLVVTEAWTLIGAHLGRAAALTFWDALRATRTPILAVEPVDLEAAWRIVHAYPDQGFSFTDCASFAIMERLGIDEAFAFDSRFLVYRFGPRRQRAIRRFPR